MMMMTMMIIPAARMLSSGVELPNMPTGSSDCLRRGARQSAPSIPTGPLRSSSTATRYP
jgi:hypothetical protein